MKVIEVLRLLKKHLLLLIVIPLVLAALVIFLTRTPSYTYSSETTLFTGIASGSSVEMDKSLSFFATNTAFDNLINVIKSRETQQAVAIRLLAQHLMLSKADPRYISENSFQQLNKITPDYIRDLIVKSGSQSKVQDTESQANKTDSETTQTAADSQAVIIQSDSVPAFSFSNLNTTSDNSITLPAEIHRADFEQTVKNLEAYMASNDTNFIYKLLYFTHPHYSVKAISSVNVQRIASSDLVKLKYDSDDPGICQQTLALITEVCIINYKLIKENRSDAVVKYFEYQLRLASGRLKVGEDKLLKFNEDNNIINYYEQSKAVAVVKEDLDVEYNNKRIKLAGTNAAIIRLEEKLGSQQQVQLKSSTIIEKRNLLSDLNSQIATAETIGYGKPVDDAKLVNLKAEAEKLKDEIRKSVNDLYTYGNTTDGIPVSKLLNDWITNVIDYEETKAGLEVLGERIKEFQKQYAIYAPAGANIKRIEREISVSEQEFLEILHGLNLAKLKMQDAELSATIKAVDPPYFPLSPNPTKRKILVLVAAFVGFLIVLSSILATEYFDDTLKNPAKATKRLKLKNVGVFPKILLSSGSLNFPFVTNRLLEMCIQKIEWFTGKKTDVNEPRTILVFSSLSNEGKTITAGNIALKLKMQGKKVLFLSFSRESLRQTETSQIGYNTESASTGAGSGFMSSGGNFMFIGRLLGFTDHRVDANSAFLQKPEKLLEINEYVKYNIDAEYFSAAGYKDLIGENPISSDSKPDYILIEIPPVLYYSFPTQLIASADLAILVCRANRTWTAADQGALDTVKNVTSKEPVFLLNGIEIEVVESVLGDLPKKRSRIRRLFKRIIRLQFHSQYQL